MWVVKLVKNHSHINCTGQCLSGNSEVFFPVMMLCDFSLSDVVIQISLLIYLSVALIQGVLMQLTHFYWNIISLQMFHKLQIWKPSVYFTSVVCAFARLSSNRFSTPLLFSRICVFCAILSMVFHLELLAP